MSAQQARVASLFPRLFSGNLVIRTAGVRENRVVLSLEREAGALEPPECWVRALRVRLVDPAYAIDASALLSSFKRDRTVIYAESGELDPAILGENFSEDATLALMSESEEIDRRPLCPFISLRPFLP